MCIFRTHQVNWALPKNQQSFFHSWMDANLKGFLKKKLRKSLSFVVVWIVWYTRNQKDFDKVDPNLEQILLEVKLRFGQYKKKKKNIEV